ncbi:MAG: hypothetical protein WCK03_00695 [Candidatus Taylorbacteria bacterium]
MKKVILITIAIISSHSYAYATSGACSYHGGVNCSAGADTDGSAICNDGWRDSTVSFSSINECYVQSPIDTCAYPANSYGATCSTETDYSTVLQSVNNLRQTYSQSNFRSGGEYTNTDYSSIGQSQLDSCRAGINLHNAQMAVYNECKQNYSNQQKAYLQSLIDKNNADKTTNLDTSCKSQFGTHSIPSTTSGYCSCEQGYSFDSSKQCVVTPPPVQIQQPTTQDPDAYLLSKGAVWNHTTQQYECLSNGEPIPLSGINKGICPTSTPIVDTSLVVPITPKSVIPKKVIKKVPAIDRNVASSTILIASTTSATSTIFIEVSTTTINKNNSTTTVQSDSSQRNPYKPWYRKIFDYFTNKY